MNNKPVLAFDCACFGASISLRAGGSTHSRQLTLQNQAKELVSAIDGILREAGVEYADLGTILTTIGPGSFTGLRIGLAALHGFVLVNATPIKTLTTLEAMAWHIARGANAPATFTVAIRAGKGEAYAQDFRQTNGTPTAQGEIYVTAETKTDWALPCYGNLVAAESPHYLASPNTETLCAIADALPTSTLADALPLYIRPPDAIIPATPAWLKA
jgi:tRNA threonylcarbamoyl adenosine modification protein YeaZ